MSDKAELKEVEVNVACGSMKENIFDSDTDASNTTARKCLSDQREEEESEENSSRFLPEIIRWLDHKVSDKIHCLVIPIYFEWFIYFWCKIYSSMVAGLTVNITYFAVVRLGYRHKDKSATTGLILICAHISTALVVLFMKKTFRRKRPGIQVTQRKHLNPLPQLSRERPWSFPSGDSAQAGC